MLELKGKIRMINHTDKIYVAGNRGLVGSAIVRNLVAKGYTNVIGRTHKELDLTNQQMVKDFFEEEKPDVVVLAAAKVGGINANNSTPAEFVYDNMQIQCNVIKCCHDYHVKKLLFLGSTCIYPRMSPQPMPEDALLTGPLEETNEAYAIAKIAGLDKGTLAEGSAADVVVFDPGQTYPVLAEEFAGKAKNTPFLHRSVTGKVTATIVSGEIVYMA